MNRPITFKMGLCSEFAVQECVVAIKRCRGFTAIELMIVIVVLAILATLAGPSFRDFIIGQRIKTISFDLFADLTYARSEAIKTNSEVIISSASGTTDWKNGWNVTWVDTTATTRTLRTHAPLDSAMTMSGTLDRIKFERNGRPLAGTSSVKFIVDDTSGKAVIASRCISVDPSGRPQSTSSTAGVC